MQYGNAKLGIFLFSFFFFLSSYCFLVNWSVNWSEKRAEGGKGRRICIFGVISQTNDAIIYFSKQKNNPPPKKKHCYFLINNKVYMYVHRRRKEKVNNMLSNPKQKVKKPFIIKLLKSLKKIKKGKYNREGVRIAAENLKSFDYFAII